MNQDSIGHRIELRLRELGKTANWLRATHGINNIYRIISGEQKPRPDYVLRMAKALKCDPRWLEFGEDGAPAADPEEFDVLADERNRRALWLYDLLELGKKIQDPEDQETARKLLEHLSSRHSDRTIIPNDLD